MTTSDIPPQSPLCELNQQSLEFWAQVEEIYNQDKYPDSLLSAAHQINSQSYEMFFKYYACKHDVFIKTPFVNMCSTHLTASRGGTTLGII